MNDHLDEYGDEVALGCFGADATPGQAVLALWIPELQGQSMTNAMVWLMEYEGREDEAQQVFNSFSAAKRRSHELVDELRRAGVAVALQDGFPTRKELVGEAAKTYIPFRPLPGVLYSFPVPEVFMVLEWAGSGAIGSATYALCQSVVRKWVLRKNGRLITREEATLAARWKLEEEFGVALSSPPSVEAGHPDGGWTIAFDLDNSRFSADVPGHRNLIDAQTTVSRVAL